MYLSYIISILALIAAPILMIVLSVLAIILTVSLTRYLKAQRMMIETRRETLEAAAKRDAEAFEREEENAREAITAALAEVARTEGLDSLAAAAERAQAE